MEGRRPPEYVQTTPMTRHPRIVVFSSVDSVLGDTGREVVRGRDLRRLAEAGVALVLCSSHTRAQLEWVRQELGIVHPFVSENGGAVYIPEGCFGFEVPNAREVAGYRAVEFGRPYADVVHDLRETADRLQIGITGFSDMSVEEVAAECRLSMLQARLAKLREYTEPFRLHDADPRARGRLMKGLHAANLTAVNPGGVFDCVGAPVDAELGVNLLVMLYRRAFPGIATVGLGSSLRDVPLMQRADRAFIVDAEDDQLIRRLLGRVPHARVMSRPGLAGWLQAIEVIADAQARPIAEASVLRM